MVLRLLRKAIPLFALAAWVHGCAASAQDADQWSDRNFTTASVPAVSAFGEGADTKLILAVLARDVMNAVGKEWENSESGARGRITAMSRQEADGPGCVAFTTTRQSFDGVNLYRGLACENAAGFLHLRDFAML
ncbi:RT0821/Lpp0805 family surface protein [Chelativorans salis]|uniref:RT0821/Lpp0805 family surface protein n=1 Tax=Chelativorans salis TaxID=2978478 RepID=A0ABT2LK80_9HYPH|nr:RT0821/Lpp0805 family surface protein [Chelativorans sp. EGI FJ00035]MCT7373594.1 RT0821/Lpp0805 family surface protein [Chelativorans sp. EGI FJ00035]